MHPTLHMPSAGTHTESCTDNLSLSKPASHLTLRERGRAFLWAQPLTWDDTGIWCTSCRAVFGITEEVFIFRLCKCLIPWAWVEDEAAAAAATAVHCTPSSDVLSSPPDTSSAQINWRRKRVLNIKDEELFLLPGERGRRIQNVRKLRAGQQPSPRTGSCSWDTAASHVTNSSWNKGGSTVITYSHYRTTVQPRTGRCSWAKAARHVKNCSWESAVQSLAISRRQASSWTSSCSSELRIQQPVTFITAVGKVHYSH